MTWTHMIRDSFAVLGKIFTENLGLHMIYWYTVFAVFTSWKLRVLCKACINTVDLFRGEQNGSVV